MICLLNPLFGVLVINQDWSYFIKPLGLVFKPWRLFLIFCGIPNVLCGLFLLYFMPESPKFTLYQGDEETTLKTLRRMHRLNTGKPDESYDVKSLIKDEESNSQCGMNIVQFMWSQTAPLFKHPHLKNTLTASFIQFCIFNTSNGFYTFFPEITNKVAIWEHHHEANVSSTVCQILKQTEITSSLNETNSCVTKLELSTYENAIYLMLLYVLGYIIIAFIINRTGKLVIITFFLFGSAFCSLLLMVIEIPWMLNYLYILLLYVGLAFNIVNASTVELFPTSLRAMAICISMMIGRIGIVVGSNVVGLLLDQFCRYTFLMPTVLLTCSGFIAFTIPNISKRVS